MRKLLLSSAVLLATLGCGPISDERWEGEATDCSDNVADFEVILLLNRAGSDVPGYAGYKQTGSDDNYSVAQIDDVEYGSNTLKFTAEYDLVGDGSQDWTVDLESDGNKYTGEIEITQNSNTVRCDVELERVN